MSDKPRTMQYQKPSPHPDRWQLWRLTEYAAMACFAAALCCGFLSYVFSVKFAVQTPAYRLYIQKLQAQSTTQPGGAMISHAPFVGQAYINRSVLTFPTTYFAVAFVGVGVAILVLKRIAQAHEPEA